jgi:hypothetical protein
VSVVFELKPGIFSGLMINTLEYASNFWFWLDVEPRIQEAALFKFSNWDDSGEYYRSKWNLFFLWAEGDNVFDQAWKFWRFPRGNRADLAKDWPPLEKWMYEAAKSLIAPLPQTPQFRKRIPMPDGTFRTIRTGKDR